MILICLPKTKKINYMSVGKQRLTESCAKYGMVHKESPNYYNKYLKNGQKFEFLLILSERLSY